MGNVSVSHSTYFCGKRLHRSKMCRLKSMMEVYWEPCVSRNTATHGKAKVFMTRIVVYLGRIKGQGASVGSWA
jgi:hypothetical protein